MNVELYYAFNAIWGHKMYTMYGMVFMMFIMMLNMTGRLLDLIYMITFQSMYFNHLNLFPIECYGL